MKRTVLALSVALLFGGGSALAQDAPDAAKLDAQKKELAAQRKELDAKAKDCRAKISASDALAAERKAVVDARKALDEKIASDPEVKKAQETGKEAQAKLAKAIDAKVAASPERAAAAKTAAELDAKRNELQYQADLIDLQLSSQFSPFAAQVEADPEVQAARAKVTALDNDIDSNPTAEVAAAQKALAAAKADLSKADGDAALAAGHKAVADAQAALKDAQSKDQRPEKIAQARQAYQAARLKKMESMPEAKALLDEAKALAAKLDENAKARDAIEAALDVYGEMIGAEDPQVAAALKKVEQTTQAFEAAMKSSGLAAMRDELRAAQKARDEKALAALAGDAAYAELAKKEQALKATVEKLSANLKGLSASDVDQLAKARAELKTVSRATYNARHAKWQDKSVLAEFEKANALYHGLGAKIKATPATASAQAAMSAASRELASMRDAKAKGLPQAKASVEKLGTLMKEAGDLRYKLAIAEFKLNARTSPVKMAVDADPSVQAAAKSMADADAAPVAAPVSAAQTKVKDAQAALKAEQGKSDSFTKAAAAVQSAEKALREAGLKDARKSELAKSQAAARDLRGKKLTALPSAADLLNQQKKIDEQLGEIDKARKAGGAGVADLRKKIEASDDAEIVALKKQIAETHKTLKEAPKDKRFDEDRAAVKKAEEAVSAKLTQLVAADAACQALQKDLEANSAKAKEIDDQLRASRKKAPTTKQAKATTKPAKVAKATTKPAK